MLEYHYGSAGSADDKLCRISALNIDDGAGADPVAQYTYLGAGSVVTAHYPELDADPDKGYTWNLATGSGATRYAGLDTFDRTLTCLWRDGTPDDVVHLAYEYDRASNRINRQDHVSKNLGTAVYRDELYEYDGLDRLVDVQRGELSGGSITGLNFRQNWADPSTDDTALDPTGNWTEFQQDTTGNTTFDVVQTRTHNEENEITDVDATSGGSWVDPLHDAVGNTTTIPRVAAPSQNYLLTYDAWNRVVKIETISGSQYSIGAYSYDGLHRRVSRTKYNSGSPEFTRRMYYTDQWQVLEERQVEDSEWLLNKQYVWGIRYIDELILRDNDTTPNGTLNIRHYALQDANFNVVALINTNGSVGRRYEYDAYGYSTTLEPDYSPGAYEYDFEYRYAGYRWDYETQLLQVRNRWYHPRLGRWVSRDPIGYDGGTWNLYEYVGGRVTGFGDPFGLCTPVGKDAQGNPVIQVGIECATGNTPVGSCFVYDLKTMQKTAVPCPAYTPPPGGPTVASSIGTCWDRLGGCKTGCLSRHKDWFVNSSLLDCYKGCDNTYHNCVARYFPPGNIAPTPSGCGDCDSYEDSDKYLNTYANCFCKCAGDSDWAQLVRGCLLDMYAKKVGSHHAHMACYTLADGQGYSRPDATLMYCFSKCFDKNPFSE